MKEKSVYKYFIGFADRTYNVHIFFHKKGLTIGRGRHSNRKTAIKLALKDLEKNLNIAELVHKNDVENRDN